MAEEILLDYSIDQPTLPTTNVETEVKVLLSVNASNAVRMASEGAYQVGANVCLVLDCSSSMRDPEFRALTNAALKVVDELRPIDILSVVAFQDAAYEIVRAERVLDDQDRARIRRKVSTIEIHRGGGTNMDMGLSKAHDLLNLTPERSMARRIIIFTDGEVTGAPPQETLQTAKRISRDEVVFDCFGFGPGFNYAFMQELVRDSNGFTEKIVDLGDIVEAFRRRFKNLKTSVSVGTRLELEFTPEVRAGRSYRYSPELAYLGKIALPGDERTTTINIGNIERDKEYSFLVTCTAPQRTEGYVRLFKATLRYDIPALELQGGESFQSVVVKYSGDDSEYGRIDGEVVKAFDEVEIGRLVGALEDACSTKDHKRASMFFDILSRRYAEIGNSEMEEHYGRLKDKYMSEGGVSLDDMNYARHRSTQKKDAGVKLVDASDLI